MSTAKRSRRRTPEARSASPLPASKRLKTTTSSHVPTKSGLGFLVDENARAGRKLEARLTNGVPDTKTTRVDESHALIAADTAGDHIASTANGTSHEVIDISSGEDESSAYESEDDAQHGTGLAAGTASNGKATAKGHGLYPADADDATAGADDESMDDVEENAAGGNGLLAEQEELSFGDMLQARHPDTIDVQASFSGLPADSALVPATSSRALAAPSTTSLGTVLTQALKTNDKDLLESCFEVNDLPSIRSTIQRLQSQHASTLLQRLAERIHKRPGRTSNLMVWVQWTLVAHGGYLATQPEVMRKLQALGQVVRERASGLQPLLHLKGKLDLLSAQLELRRNMRAASRGGNATDEDEDAVLYVDGQDDDDWSDDDDVAMTDRVGSKALGPPMPKPVGQTETPRSDLSESGDDGSIDDMPNGAEYHTDIESDEEADEEAGEGLFDVEAEETSDDEAEDASSGEDAESAPESVDDTEPSDDESEPEVKRPPPKTLNRKR